MFATVTQTIGGEERNQETLPVTISEHAQEQWAARVQTDISLKTALEQSVPVEAPEADSTDARLYAPCDALLVIKHATVTTVLHNDGRINAPGLIECPTCENLIDPVDANVCPWCGRDHTEATRPGCVTLTWGDI